MSANSLLHSVKNSLATMASAVSGPGVVWLPHNQFTLAATGAPLAVFANGASTTPGVQITDSETWTIRWNNDAAPAAISTNFLLPFDLDPNFTATVNAICSKTGATVGDATTLTVAYWNNIVGALHDADTDAGGASNAVTGDATAKTTALLRRTIAAADLVASTTAAPAFAALTIKPTAGTLGTDDFLIHAIWFKYTKRTPT